MATISALKIGGVTMPDPALEGFEITKEKIWSADTGRTATGYMVGTVVAVKTKVSIKWPPMNMEEAKKIGDVVDNAGFTTVTFTDADGITKTKDVYFGTPTYSVYSWVQGMQYVTVSVNAIER